MDEWPSYPEPQIHSFPSIILIITENAPLRRVSAEGRMKEAALQIHYSICKRSMGQILHLCIALSVGPAFQNKSFAHKLTGIILKWTRAKTNFPSLFLLS